MNAKPVCPKCGSDRIQFDHDRRCGQCGAQFALDRFPVVTAALGRKRRGLAWLEA
jgi:hypothetical protein